ncbi:hypothetical protein ACEZDB_12025 [Streptacidiphilus sp. N1-3]|uniref:Uncharacterized protein n=1 Tax=Streptacidiphilus alkalitolerans TaxID=3342712 RepID=A0ABV6WZL4_9ACTN
MTGVRGAAPDLACVLPGRPEWIQDAAYLGDEGVLDFLACAAAADSAHQDDSGYLLPAGTYRTAALTIASLAAAVPKDGCAGQVVLCPMPAWKLETLWDVLLVLRRTVAGDPDTDVVRDLLDDLVTYEVVPARTVEQVADDLERVLAVLMLDLPATKVVATAVALDRERDQGVIDAYRQITAAWTAAGVRH